MQQMKTHVVCLCGCEHMAMRMITQLEQFFTVKKKLAVFFHPQVIVFYHHPSALSIPVMWPGNKIPAPWANTTEPNKLIQVRNIQTLAVIDHHLFYVTLFYII